MKEMPHPMRSATPVLLVVLILSISFHSVGRLEEEPNDSLLDPEVLSKGSMSGSVSWTNESAEEGDIDAYKVDTPADHILFFSLTKTDEGQGSIYLVAYDAYKQRMDLEPNSERDLEVKVQGEASRHYIQNLRTPDTIFLTVRGEGNYTLNVHLAPILEPSDPPLLEDDPYNHHYNHYDAVDLDEGERNGSVYSIQFESLTFVDSDLFLYYMSDEGTLDITIERTDDGDLPIEVAIYEYSEDEYGAEKFTLENKGDVENVTWEVDDYWGEDIYILIEGEGNYTLKVDEKSQLPEDLWVVIVIMAAMMLVPLVFLAVLLMIIVLIVVVILRTGRGKKKK